MISVRVHFGTLHGKSFVTNMAQPGETAPDAFVVVVNHLGQHSLWHAALPVPRGWRRQSGAMPKGDCLAAIEAAWRDIAPASVTARPGDQAAGDGGGFVHELFARQAAARPDAVAIVAGRTRVTYRELDESAGRLAHHLRETGVGPEVVVGVHLERGIDLIRAILAIMKAGGGYLPLDPALPEERLTRMCSQAGPAVADNRDGSLVSLRRGQGAAARRTRGEPRATARGGDRPGWPPASGQPVLRHPYLGLHRRPQGGRRQLRQPGERDRPAGGRLPDRPGRPGSADGRHGL